MTVPCTHPRIIEPPDGYPWCPTCYCVIVTIEPDLIAAGVNPADLVNPTHPGAACPGCGTDGYAGTERSEQ